MNYVIDTSSILYNWNVLKSFPKSSIFIPYVVLKQLDKFKTELGQNGFNARKACEFICKNMSSSQDKAKIKKIWRLENGSRILLCQPVQGNQKQDKIINTIKEIKKLKKTDDVILVTQKSSFRLMASTLNIKSQDYNDIGEFKDYNGWNKIQLDQLQLQQLKYMTDDIVQLQKFNNVNVNSYIVPTYQNQPLNNLVLRKQPNNTCVVIDRKPHLCGLTPKNLQQMMACDLLANDNIPLVSMIAVAGTGKTLLAIAQGLQKVLVEKRYSKLIITRPVVPIGRDIGFLPGDLQDKMNEWLMPFWNNIEYIASINKNKGKNKFSMQKLKILLDKEGRKQYIQILPISYMRGCSLSDAYVIIDQAQNTTPSEMKTIITRIGENAKLVLTGDIEQIDSPYLTKQTNGLTMTINKFSNQQLFGYVKLLKSERSDLSKLANKLLFD